MRNKKFILHKALLDALYTLIVKRNRLEKNLEELDINADIDKCKAYYKKYRTEYKSLEEAFAALPKVDKTYRDGVKERSIKGSKEDKKHGIFQIYYCDYAIIEEGIMSICEELEVPYNKVKEELYRIGQMYHTMSAYDLANPHQAVTPIHPFMKDVYKKQWFKNAFSINARNILEAVVKNNLDNIIKKEYILHKTIW